MGRLGLTLPLLSLLMLCGCPPPVPSDGGNDGIPSLDSAGNGSFNSATIVPLDGSGFFEFTGSIQSATDVDMYNIGPINPGDRIFVDVRAADPRRLDLVAAIFSSEEFLQYYSDDRANNDFNPLIDFVLRGDPGLYYLGIQQYYQNNATGSYTVTVQITPNAGVPPPAGQVVFLDWDGGENITIPNVGTFDLPPFDAADLGPYEGQTEQMKDRIEQIVAQRYEGYDLVLLNSDDHPIPSGPHSTVYFGGFSQGAFAISEQVDPYNRDHADDAIIFTRTYDVAFRRHPTFEQMAQAVGNTVAHELGHLLGLVHTADCEDLMDTRCGNDSILVPQQFGTAVLDHSVFSLGLQNELELLDWILGFVGL
ncbi:MAG TPA: hypothetical protein PK920_12750 [Phycisphaerae bacterium]|nr:hypothetical protein [Phycisphaerae bacterium]